MVESANSGLRERRKLQTAEHLTSVCRRLTAEHGINGFTVEEVCDEVGVSRRTFFNYFATKEDAVMGVDPAEEAALLAEEFLARGSRGWPAVLDDLIELIPKHFQATGIDAGSHAAFVAAMDREPKLLSKFMGVTRDRERETAVMIALREGVAADDPRAEASVQILVGILRTTGERYLQSTNSRDFGELLVESLESARTVLSPRKARQ